MRRNWHSSSTHSSERLPNGLNAALFRVLWACTKWISHASYAHNGPTPSADLHLWHSSHSSKSPQFHNLHDSSFHTLTTRLICSLSPSAASTWKSTEHRFGHDTSRPATAVTWSLWNLFLQPVSVPGLSRLSVHLSSSQFISFHLISFHFISNHLSSSHIISYHLSSSHIISYHLSSSHFISVHLSSSHFISFHLSSSQFISVPLSSSPFISFYLVSSRFILFHLISSHLISCRLISSRFI